MHICPCWHIPSRLWGQFSAGAPSVTPDLDKGRAVSSQRWSLHCSVLTGTTERRSRAALASSCLCPVQLSPSQGCHSLLLEGGRWVSPGLCCHSAGISTKFPSRREKTKKHQCPPSWTGKVLPTQPYSLHNPCLCFLT